MAALGFYGCFTLCGSRYIVCMSICMYMYIYICTHLPMHSFVCFYSCVHAFIHVYLAVAICINVSLSLSLLCLALPIQHVFKSVCCNASLPLFALCRLPAPAPAQTGRVLRLAAMHAKRRDGVELRAVAISEDRAGQWFSASGRIAITSA